MADPQTEQTLTPVDAAKELNISIHTVRRWCEWHSEYLSLGANPPPGAARRLIWRDIEVFKVVKELREQGLQTRAINKRLSELTFAVPDTSEIKAIAPSETPREEAQHAIVETSASTSLSTELAVAVLQRLENLEKRQQVVEQRGRDNFIMFGAGIIVSALFFLIILWLVSLTQ